MCQNLFWCYKKQKSPTITGSVHCPGTLSVIRGKSRRDVWRRTEFSWQRSQHYSLA